ncbi:ABC-three component system protein [Pseudomonas poae]|uniref:ABC-three component system protein n=1 Tax=Pseudomonas poae TaxID=200451 RepID=UPI0034D5D7F6
MTADELIVSYAVKVNGGSGVLVSALSSEYTYVLTAKHAIGNPIAVTRAGSALRVIGVPYLHPDNDCAIIKVEYQDGIVQRLLRDELPTGSRISYVGYPETNVCAIRPYKIYTGLSNDNADKLIVCNLDGGPGQASIEGMSGGGIYHYRNGRPYLWAVEFRMDDEDPDARYGRVLCHSIESYDEIIQTSGLDLIAPFYMKCFSNFTDDIFHFNARNPNNVAKLRDKLGELADWLISKNMPAPHDLMLRYKKELLLSSEDPISTVFGRELWVAYLEFIVMCAVLDDVLLIDEEYLISLDRRRRFMYSCSHSNWLRKLSVLMEAARNLLDENGVIFVNSPEENAVGLPDKEDIDEVLANIAASPKFRSQARIDSAHSGITNTYSFAHLKGLRNKLVLDNHRRYGERPIEKQLCLLKDFYDRAIKERH